MNNAFNTMSPLILASTSPRRKELFEKLRIPFTVVASDYEEDMTLPLDPFVLAKTLSRGKAEKVAESFIDSVVVGADTFVAFNGKVLGKPHTTEKAMAMLKDIRGQWISIITGYTIMHRATDRSISETVETKVLIAGATDEEIRRAYKRAKEVYDHDALCCYGLFDGAGLEGRVAPEQRGAIVAMELHSEALVEIGRAHV